MFAEHCAAVHEVLRSRRLVNEALLAEAQREHETTGRPLAAVVLERGLVDRSRLLQSIAEHHGYEFAADVPAKFDGDAIAAVSGTLARTHGVMPWRKRGDGLDVLLANPFDLTATDDLAFTLSRPVQFFLADPDKVEIWIAQHYGGGEPSPEALQRELETTPIDRGGRPATLAHDLEALAAQAPIVRFVNLVLIQAVGAQASDVHFEPFEQEFKIRYRVDGALYEMTPPPTALGLPIVSRIKVLANLNIAERRVPQDGRMSIRVGERTVDLRVSTLPTQFGESVVLRVLDQANVRLELTQLGLPGDVLQGVREMVRRPNGIVIVTGPTGSGKTTTLYSALREINSTEVKILTVEDPVEYEIEGVMQVAVNAATGLTFASALRSFLRQDPNVLMVGEIRDLETAQIAIQASLTGHLVLTTLHTNDAAGAVTRLIDMGVEPFLIASTLEAVLAQRLVRRICLHCRTSYAPDATLLRELGLTTDDAAGRPFWRGAGCPECNHSGYRGRLGICEWLRVTEAMRDAITSAAPTHELREHAIARGMQPLRQAGVRAVLDGQTTVEEVMRHT